LVHLKPVITPWGSHMCTKECFAFERHLHPVG
jgi:hypothetical protein